MTITDKALRKLLREAHSLSHGDPDDLAGILLADGYDAASAALILSVRELAAEVLRLRNELRRKRNTRFVNELASLLNRHCAENGSNTPDFILAEYLVSCLETFESASNQREHWYGCKLQIGGPVKIEEAL